MPARVETLLLRRLYGANGAAGDRAPVSIKLSYRPRRLERAGVREAVYVVLVLPCVRRAAVLRGTPATIFSNVLPL